MTLLVAASLTLTSNPNKPQRLYPVEAAILDELKAIPQWVCWSEHLRDEKWTKVPYVPRGINSPASATSPETWTTFADAYGQFQSRHGLKGGAYQGVGFVLTKALGITAIDLDDCYKPESGLIEPWALEALAELECYAELSPSGKGIRGFVRGNLPVDFGRNDRKGFECYDDKRYITITGVRLPGSTDHIPSRQAELDALHRRIFAVKYEQEAEGERVAAEARLRAETRRQALELARANRTPGTWDLLEPEPSEWPEAYCRTAYSRCHELLATAQPGVVGQGRHDRLSQAAYAIGRFQGAGAPGAQEALDELETIAHALMPGRAREVTRTIRQCAAAGMAKPKPAPAPRLSVIEQYIPDELPAAVTEQQKEEAREKKERAKIKGLAWAQCIERGIGDRERKSLIRFAQCALRGVGRECTRPGCKHQSCHTYRCGRELCPFCSGRFYLNLGGALEEMLKAQDASLREQGVPVEAWYLEVTTPDDLASFSRVLEESIAKVPRKLRKRASGATRVIRAPSQSVLCTRDGLVAEALQAATGAIATRVDSLARLMDPIQKAFSRRSARAWWAINDLVGAFEAAGVPFPKVGDPGTPLSAELEERCRSSEFRGWLRRSPISVAGRDSAIPWPDSERIREYARRKAQMHRAEQGLLELADPHDCPEHGSVYLGPWQLVHTDGSKIRVTLPEQPEVGKRPSRKQVLAADPALSRYG